MDGGVRESGRSCRPMQNWLGRRLPTETISPRRPTALPKGAKESNILGATRSPSECHEISIQTHGSFPRWVRIRLVPAPLVYKNLVGNGWAWTRTVFAQFEALNRCEFYPSDLREFL